MKRRALKVVVFLLLGAIVNVAVAWGLVLSKFDLPMTLNYMSNSTAIDGSVNINSSQSEWLKAKGYESSGVRTKDEVVFGLHQCAFRQDSATARGQMFAIELKAGVPLLSLRTSLWKDPTTSRWQFKDAIGLCPEPKAMTLPLEPLWPGFAINTIFYAAVLWMVFAFPFVVRRRRRIKRGLCPACAYPEGTSPVCTECGEPVGGAGRRV